jgi:FkbM family methyltransferase
MRSLLIYYGKPLRHRRLKKLYRDFIRPGDLAIDAGAHVGNHTRAFLALGARIVAVEPQPLFAGFLRTVFHRNQDVVVIEAALGDAPGRAELRVSTRTPTVSTLDGGWQRRVSRAESFSHVRWDQRIEVTVETLDGLIAAHGGPSLIKLDVEGAEAVVLRGLSEPVPLVCFEALPAARDAALECLDRLVELGYEWFNRSSGEQAALRPDWTGPDAVRQFLADLSPDSREQNIFARLESA